MALEFLPTCHLQGKYGCCHVSCHVSYLVAFSHRGFEIAFYRLWIEPLPDGDAAMFVLKCKLRDPLNFLSDLVVPRESVGVKSLLYTGLVHLVSGYDSLGVGRCAGG